LSRTSFMVYAFTKELRVIATTSPPGRRFGRRRRSDMGKEQWAALD